MKKLLLISFSLLITSLSINAQSWSELGGTNALAANNEIQSICTDKSGNVYAAGSFTNSSGKEYVAKWNKATNTWSELGGKNSLAANASILSVCIDNSGNVYTAGYFTNSSSKCYVAKWNGSAWSELGGLNALAANSSINAICIDTNSNILYVGGGFSNSKGYQYVAKWNGSVWSELGGLDALSANSTINSICIDKSGNVYATGYFSNSYGSRYVAKWNGSSWSELGGLNALSANGAIISICADTIGNIYAGGQFTNSSNNYYIAKWNGSSWSELGGLNALADDYTTGAGWTYNLINTVYVDRNDNVYTAGYFTNSNYHYFVAKYNGNIWGELGGLDGLAAYDIIDVVCSDKNGNIYAAGNFANNGGTGNQYVAVYNSTTTPLQFISFTAQKQNDNALLQWQTANEVNTNYFNVQRSSNGKDFTTIGNVNATDISGVNNYTYTDLLTSNVSPLTNLYYRLQEIDKDGSSTYSSIATISFTNQPSITISPNPAKGTVYVTGTNIKYITIADNSGKNIISQAVNNQTHVAVNISNLAAGIYIVKVTDAQDNVQTEELMVQ